MAILKKYSLNLTELGCQIEMRKNENLDSTIRDYIQGAIKVVSAMNVASVGTLLWHLLQLTVSPP